MSHYRDDEPPEKPTKCGCGKKHLYRAPAGADNYYTDAKGRRWASRCLIMSLLTRVDALEAREKQAKEELAQWRRDTDPGCT